MLNLDILIHLSYIGDEHSENNRILCIEKKHVQSQEMQVEFFIFNNASTICKTVCHKTAY
jgi:hypothetical protein